MKNKINIFFIGSCYYLSFFFINKIIKKNIYNLCGIITKKEINKKIETKYKKKNIKIFKPKTYNEIKKLEKKIKKLKIDIILVISYGFKIPQNIINIPKFGCINMHASLLPKFRGSSPIQQVILNGDSKTGITFIKMNNKIDKGDILIKKKIKINKNDNYISIIKKIQEIGKKYIFFLFKNIKKLYKKKIKQNEKKATYTKKIKKTDGIINWKESAQKIDRKIRAFCIWPKTFFYYKKNIIFLWSIKIEKNIKLNKKKIPGKILSYNKKLGLRIETKTDIINIKKLQLNNRKKIKINDLINSKPFFFKENEIIK